MAIKLPKHNYKKDECILIGSEEWEAQMLGIIKSTYWASSNSLNSRYGKKKFYVVYIPILGTTIRMQEEYIIKSISKKQFKEECVKQSLLK